MQSTMETNFHQAHAIFVIWWNIDDFGYMFISFIRFQFAWIFSYLYYVGVAIMVRNENALENAKLTRLNENAKCDKVNLIVMFTVRLFAIHFEMFYKSIDEEV